MKKKKQKKKPKNHPLTTVTQVSVVVWKTRLANGFPVKMNVLQRKQ